MNNSNEYNKDIKQCNDTEATGIDNTEGELPSILSTMDYGVAAIGKSILDSAGIENFIDGDSADSIFGGFAPVHIDIRVHKKDEQNAKQLLKDLQ